MEQIRQYLLSITAAAVICSIILGIQSKKSTYSSIIRMLCGLFMAITMISPLLKVRISDYSAYFGDLQTEAEDMAAAGKQIAELEAVGIIKRNMEAYIVDKASSIGLVVRVEVTLAEYGTPYPCAVQIQGAASPYAKRQLQRWMKEELGIPEENQIWI